MTKATEERLKFTATWLNGLSLGFMGFAAIRPLIEEGSAAFRYVALAIVLHAAGHYLLSRLKGDSR